MTPTKTRAGYSTHDGVQASHRFAGANSAIPFYYGYPDQLEAVRAVLRDAVALDFMALTRVGKGASEEIAPLGLREFSIRPGDELTLDVVVQNSRIGHSLVPEQRDFYECWLEFEVLDETGGIIFHSGALDGNGFLDPKAHSYTNRLIDKSGDRLVRHEVWRTRLKAYDNTIMPGRSDVARFHFRIPEQARGPFRVAAKINYRRFRKQYTDFILGKSASYPVLALASKELVLRTGKNAITDTQDKRHELLRWNNYGIALLGQQQWWKAADAFAQTTQIDPGYPDGYVNQAIAEYSKWIESRKENPDGPGVFSLDNANAPPEKFNRPLELLQKALALKPDYARALYYQGLILRLQNRLDEAVPVLSQAVRQFPVFRQGRQELGYVLYLQKNFAQAAEQFEAVKKINPDDVTACYYLSIAYARLGKPAEAQENAALYAEHRDDPNNYALNFNFVQGHAEEAQELTAYHLHTGGQ